MLTRQYIVATTSVVVNLVRRHLPQPSKDRDPVWCKGLYILRVLAAWFACEVDEEITGYKRSHCLEVESRLGWDIAPLLSGEMRTAVYFSAR